ncbi:hypothetical protein OIE66_18480 [Nonomuraea sp. NBC_01738]|uniref:hypothetical protein n=1 Tax=Nonomuraea sp. NBC_01738 TaxID=2976003 RepID=UPI002E0DF5FB|nr:hypothetical protein OIE66_18480 [Nonomuraea sp. NBC_01738]
MADQSRGRPGWLHVGPLEERLTRAWPTGTFPSAENLLAIMTIAAIPRALATQLAGHLAGGIIIGPGAVPDLPGFEHLRSIPLPLQAGEWDRSAGVYDPQTRRIGIGSVPTPSVSVAAHEVAHALDHAQGAPSRSPFWVTLHAQLASRLAPPYRHDVGELFAESFAAALTKRARRLIQLMGDDEPSAQQVYTWLAGRYGIG